MARSSWNIEKKNGSFVADGSIYRPNEPISVDFTATQSKISLADGSQAFVTPETVFSRDPLRFVWLEIPDSDAFRTKIEAYVQSGDYLRITTHLSETLTGRFIFVRRIWLSGVADTYDLEAGYDRIE